MKKTIITTLLTFGVLTTFSQNVGINSTGANPHPSALLDLDASPNNNTGFAMPRLTTAQRLAIIGPINGLLAYDTDLGGYYRFSTINNKWDCATTPAGTFDYFCNVSAPIGYLVCDGSLQSTTTYPELFNAIGYLYGGSGTSFQLPDLRGEFIRGAALTGTVDVGRIVGSKQAGTIVVGDFDPVETPGSMQSSSGNYQSNYGADSFDATVYPPITTIASYNTASGTYNQASVPNNFGITRPRNIALLPCIKY
jgi:microcystin-dependent protein